MSLFQRTHNLQYLELSISMTYDWIRSANKKRKSSKCCKENSIKDNRIKDSDNTDSEDELNIINLDNPFIGSGINAESETDWMASDQTYEDMDDELRV
jgi:hypothetical protein